MVLSVAVLPGQSVGVGAPVATFTIPKTLEIQATVVQEDYPLVQVGQSVNLYFDALPDTAVTGHVVRIVPQRTPMCSRSIRSTSPSTLCRTIWPVA